MEGPGVMTSEDAPVPENPAGDAPVPGGRRGPPLSTGDPVEQFRRWLAAAGKTEISDPEAMALATVDASGLPDVRMVLLKHIDSNGLVFYTNTQSAKGIQLDGNPQAAACFHWKTIRRQVRFRGSVTRVTGEEADAYFMSRPRNARIGAWASDQSRPAGNRFALGKRVAAKTVAFGLKEVTRPPFWSGYRLSPVRVEFWVDRPFRLHERLLYSRDNENTEWTTQWLFP